MQSIAINTQYGGFSLSPFAVKRLAELQGKQCYFFTHESGNCHKHIPITLEQAGEEFMWFAYTVPNPDEVAGSQENWYEMTLEEKQASNKRWDDISIEDGREIKRDDPNLIKVIKELKKKANGKYTTLKIVKIPDGVEWEIEEYDGNEWISEKHRTWN